MTADGTDAHPFLISTPAELSCIMQNPADYWGTGLHFRQTADIDMTGTTWSSPIGGYDLPFHGSFNGDEFTIAHFSYESSHSGDVYQGDGLFGFLAASASVTNTNLVDARIMVHGLGFGSARIGVLAGTNQGSISNTRVSGAITIDQVGVVSGVGGIAGAVEAGGSLTDVESVVDIRINSTMSLANAGTILLIGALVGEANNAVISRAEARGSIALVTTDYAKWIGGLAGGLNRGGMSNSSAQTTISISGAYGTFDVGGLVGLVEGAPVSTSFAAGSITNSGVGPITQSGALLGETARFSGNDSSLTNSVFDADSYGAQLPAIGEKYISTTVLGVAGLSSAILTEYDTYATTTYLTAAWDIYNGYEPSALQVWGICDGVDYPFLRLLANNDPCAMTPVDPGIPSVDPSGGTLAATGVKPAAPLAVGVVLLLVGLGVVVLMRRRDHSKK